MATIRKQRDKWQVQIRRKGIKPLAKSFSTKSDATAWAAIKESEIARGVFVDPRQAAVITLEDAISRYLDEYNNPDPTRISRCKRLRSHLGGITLSMITSTEIAKYRNQRLEVASPTTVGHELGMLHRILVLVTSEWGIQLPRGIPKVQRPKQPRGRDRRISPLETANLLAALSTKSICRDVVQFAIETGMRRGEILNIRTVDLNRNQRTLHIPKTKTGVPRTIPLSKTAIALLAKHRGRDELVFEVSESQLTRAFNKARTDTQLFDLRFHDLRHEATSRFFEMGLNMIEVATITGHLSLEMLSRYTHLKAADLVLKLR